MLQRLLKGRLNRKNFLLTVIYAFLIGVVGGIFSAAFPESEVNIRIATLIVGGLIGIIVIPVDIRRAHDIGWKGVWVLVISILFPVYEVAAHFVTTSGPIFTIFGSLVILANILLALFLIFAPGDAGANQFGDEDTSNHLKTFNIKAVVMNEK